jgi:DNA modification methylase
VPQNSNRYEPEFEYMFVVSKGKPKTFNSLKTKKLYKDNRTFKNGQRNKDGKFAILKIGLSEEKPLGNIWAISTGGGIATKDKVAYEHPAIFPEKLAAQHITSWTDKNDLVLDPFNGSGTTTKMAKLLGRNFIGIEISQKYCDIANQRLRQNILI